MKEVNITTMESLLSELNGLPNNFIYRGHANAEWQLESSLERLIGGSWNADFAKKQEELSLLRFMSKFHLYDLENTSPDSKLGWLSLMQHYGVPTRLLDFTESPYVALYFALESYDRKASPDLAVIAIDYTAIMSISIAEVADKCGGVDFDVHSINGRQDKVYDSHIDNCPINIAWISEPQLLNARLDRQGGSFLLSGNHEVRIQELLSDPKYTNAQCTKYVIHRHLYLQIYALLRKMNITSKSVYGSLDGLAKGIRMEMQSYT